jgi:hypothetical protein
MNQPLFEGPGREMLFPRKRLICLGRVNLSILCMRVQVRRFHSILRDNPQTIIKKIPIGKASKPVRYSYVYNINIILFIT